MDGANTIQSPSRDALLVALAAADFEPEAAAQALHCPLADVTAALAVPEFARSAAALQATYRQIAIIRAIKADIAETESIVRSLKSETDSNRIFRLANRLLQLSSPSRCQNRAPKPARSKRPPSPTAFPKLETLTEPVSKPVQEPAPQPVVSAEVAQQTSPKAVSTHAHPQQFTEPTPLPTSVPEPSATRPSTSVPSSRPLLARPRQHPAHTRRPAPRRPRATSLPYGSLALHPHTAPRSPPLFLPQHVPRASAA